MIPIDPSGGRKNGRAVIRRKGRTGKRFVGTSDAYQRFKADVSLHAARQLGSVAPFRSGILACSLTVYCKSQRHLDRLPPGFLLGGLDATAALDATLDGLQSGGLIDDDARLVEAHVRKRLDPRNPRIAVAIWHLNP